jgi:hypothetical protein
MFDRANWHPLANLFPIMPEEDLLVLAADIKKEGLRDKIVLYEDKVLDGRNRLLAMQRAGLELREECFTPFRSVKEPGCAWGDCAGTPLAWIVSKNLTRRHLTTSQRAAIAVDLESLFAKEISEREHERKTTKANLPESSKGQARDRAADAMKVSPRSVQTAKKIKQKSAEEFDSIKRGETTVNAAAKKVAPPVPARMSAREQRRHALLEKFPEHKGKSNAELEKIAQEKIAAGDMQDPAKVNALKIQATNEFTTDLQHAKDGWNRNELIIRKMADDCCESGTLIAWLDVVIKMKDNLDPERIYRLQKVLRQASALAAKYADALTTLAPQTANAAAAVAGASEATSPTTLACPSGKQRFNSPAELYATRSAKGKTSPVAYFNCRKCEGVHADKNQVQDSNSHLKYYHPDAPDPEDAPPQPKFPERISQKLNRVGEGFGEIADEMTAVADAITSSEAAPKPSEQPAKRGRKPKLNAEDIEKIKDEIRKKFSFGFITADRWRSYFLMLSELAEDYKVSRQTIAHLINRLGGVEQIVAEKAAGVAA